MEERLIWLVVKDRSLSWITETDMGKVRSLENSSQAEDRAQELAQSNGGTYLVFRMTPVCAFSRVTKLVETETTKKRWL